MASPGAAFSAALAAEDFAWVETPEEMGMAPDKYREVFDLAQRGTRAFRDRRFDELALKDAEKIVSSNSNAPRPYLLKAYALILLEHYHEAREALLAGLQVDPLRSKNIPYKRNFPEEYAERRSEHETMTYAGVDLMPLFVMDVVLPCQKMALNIFEPRYRLMV
nr:unnamed protein product [Digitaria exilis]